MKVDKMEIDVKTVLTELSKEPELVEYTHELSKVLETAIKRKFRNRGIYPTDKYLVCGSTLVESMEETEKRILENFETLEEYENIRELDSVYHWIWPVYDEAAGREKNDEFSVKGYGLDSFIMYVRYILSGTWDETRREALDILKEAGVKDDIDNRSPFTMTYKGIILRGYRNGKVKISGDCEEFKARHDECRNLWKEKGRMRF